MPLLRTANEQLCQPPLDDEEVEGIAHGILRYAAGDPNGPQTHVARLSALLSEAHLFHDPRGDAYAVLNHEDRGGCVRVEGVSFRGWLVARYYRASGAPVNPAAVEQAVMLVAARARFEGPEEHVHLRVAGEASTTYLDLAGEAGAARIEPTGWSLTEWLIPRFRRNPASMGMPTPTRGGSIDELRAFVNVPSDGDFRLVVGWLLATLRPSPPYPLLVLTGEQGSAKSTTARVLKQLIDPEVGGLRTFPRSEQDLMIQADSSWVLAFDNLSKLPVWGSDALCRLATGGGFATRRLYTDQEQVVIEASRPVIMNGIEEVVTRGDLLDRSLVVHLPPIEGCSRRAEGEFWEAFEEARPRILGALLDAVAGALRELPDVELKERPRMADFALWFVAVERALGWPEGSAMGAYEGTRRALMAAAAEDDVLFEPLRLLLREGRWEGTATKLLRGLRPLAGEAVEGRLWPTGPKAIADRLRRLAPSLRERGFEVSFDRKAGTGERLIGLNRFADPSSQPSQPSQASSEDPQVGGGA